MGFSRETKSRFAAQQSGAFALKTWIGTPIVALDVLIPF